MYRRVGQRAYDVQHLDDRARPAVCDDERQRVLMRRLDLDEVDVEAVDLRDELRQRVQPRLEPPEVVLGAPVGHELLHRRELHALCLVRDGLPFGPPRRRNAPAKVDERLLRNVDAERPDRGIFGDSGGCAGRGWDFARHRSGPPQVNLRLLPSCALFRGCQLLIYLSTADHGRNDLKAARTSSQKICGCSHAAKWPPLSTSFEWVMLPKGGSPPLLAAGTVAAV